MYACMSACMYTANMYIQLFSPDTPGPRRAARRCAPRKTGSCDTQDAEQPKSLAPNAMWGPLPWQCCAARSICSRRRATCGWQHCTEDSQTATAAAAVVVAIVAAGIAAAGGGVIVAAATRTWKRIPWPHGTDDLSPNPA